MPAWRSGSSRCWADRRGRREIAAATKQAAIDQTSIYTYMDDEVISTATVSSEYASEGITGGKAQISGSFDRESASALAGNINAGALQYNLKLEELRAVGPTLGEKSLETSLKAGAVGLLLVVLFMILYYRVPGLMASIALCAYTGLFMLVLSITQANLTLPGIAGIICPSVWPSMRTSSSLSASRKSCAAARARKRRLSRLLRAFAAILDSNITTFIAAGVLYVLGSGSIRLRHHAGAGRHSFPADGAGVDQISAESGRRYEHHQPEAVRRKRKEGGISEKLQCCQK
ncbi:MAG: preprotein translocase subunit SecD [Acutalibacteraceae bacterium]